MPSFVLVAMAALAFGWAGGGARADAAHGRDVERCRCAQLTLDRYFLEADIVVVARITAVDSLAADAMAGERVAVTFDAQFNQGRAFKGDVGTHRFLTPTTTASCGVPIEVGATYLLFATLQPGAAAAGPDAWFDTCSGSRQYPDARHRAVAVDFVDTPDNRVIPRFFELQAAGREGAESVASDPTKLFHTSPACWSGPRVYQQGSPSPSQREQVDLLWGSPPPIDADPVVSPNGAYEARSGSIDGGAAVVVEVERRVPLVIRLQAATEAPTPTWMSESLLFVRVRWGRAQFSDLLIDVEEGRLVYEEASRFGVAAYEQYRDACLGQCPCAAVPGSADTLSAPPAPTPTPAALRELATFSERQLSFLDEDWDGRVFTEAGGRAFTLSSLKAAADRPEHAVDVLEIRLVEGVPWLHVEIYAVSTCTDSNARPAHAGWVPAFSSQGAFVAGSWPGGC